MSTATLAKFASELRYEDLPSEVVEQAKCVLEDFIGISLYASRHTPWGVTIAEFVANESNGRGPSTVIGWGTKATASRAALANGTMALGFEYDDIHMGSATHPHSAVVSAALAIGEEKRISGRDLVAAIVAGYEVMGRVGLASGKSVGLGTMGRGLYPTQIYGVFGAAAAAGRILGLDADRMCMALGLAGEQAGGTTQSHAEGAWSRRWHGGKAAENGITAAGLAHAGFVGPKQILEGQFGLYRAFALDFDAARLTEGLGRSWEIMDVWLKAHACCGGWHSAIDSLLEMRATHAIAPDDVLQIHVRLREISPLQARKDFSTIVQAQFSAPFCLAVAMLNGRAGPGEFTPATIVDPIITRYAIDRVEATFDDELEKRGQALRTMPSRVTIRLNDGREFENEAIFPKGHPQNPRTLQETRAKFDELAGAVLTGAQADQLNAAIRNVEKIEDVSALASLLCRGGSGVAAADAHGGTTAAAADSRMRVAAGQAMQTRLRKAGSP